MGINTLIKDRGNPVFFLDYKEGKMLFYDNFKKKIENSDFVLKEKYIFGLSLKKRVIWLFSGIMLIAVGGLMGYEAYIKHQGIGHIILSIFVVFMGITFLAMIGNYKMTIDTLIGKIIHKKAEIDIENIEKVVCKRMFSGKKYDVCIDIVTKDKVEMVIPLIMNRKVEFVSVIKKMMGNKFSIE